MGLLLVVDEDVGHSPELFVTRYKEFMRILLGSCGKTGIYQE
jgi:hypothetical protein